MNSKKILIVEDEIIAAESLKERLIERGYTVLGICENGDEAIEKTRETCPDIILMDILLEGSRIDGIEASKEILNNQDIPIIYITAHGQESLDRAITTGPYGLINKPYRINDITCAIETALYKHKMEVENKKSISKEATKDLEQFLAKITHEIRNPLSIIRGYSELLIDLGASKKQVEFIQKIEHSTDKASRLADDLLDHLKMRVGKFTLKNKNFAIRKQISHIIQTHTPMFEKKGLKLEAQIAEDVPEYVNGDPFRLEQILSNFIGNSLKFTNKGSCRIKLTKRAQCNEKPFVILDFSVQDTGIGIPEDKQKNIFEPFAQVDPSHTTQFGGTGLGLTIIKQLIELMGGDVWVRSKVNQGTTFSFTIVLKKGEKPKEE